MYIYIYLFIYLFIYLQDHFQHVSVYNIPNLALWNL